DSGERFTPVAEAVEGLSVFFDLDGKHLWYGTFDGQPRLAQAPLDGGSTVQVKLPPLTKDAVGYIAQNPVARSADAIATFGGGVEAVNRFFAEHRVDSLAVYTDRSLQVNSALRVVGVPTTVLVDREGREIARHVGPAQWDSTQAVEGLRRIIAQSGST